MSSTQVEIEMGIWLEDVLSKPLNTKVLDQIMIESLNFAKEYGWDTDPLYCRPNLINCLLIGLYSMCYRILEQIDKQHHITKNTETIADVRDTLEIISQKYMMSEVPQLA